LILTVATSEIRRTQALLLLLSKKELLAQIPKGLGVDLALNNAASKASQRQKQTQLTAEVSIANQDIGFVNAGQMAEVKLETFSYTMYGTVQAKVDVVTADAVTDEKKGSYYPATLTLSQKDMLIDGKRIALSPGMNITAEIKTGQRRIIEFLLSPVQRAGAESLRER
jgi:hemolysin D